MEGAGLFCWKWLSSSLSPWPRAVGSVRARLVLGGEGEAVNWMHWRALTGGGTVATLPSTGWRHQPAAVVGFSNKDCAHFQGSVRLHHGKRRLSPTPVYHKHTAHFCPIGGASGLLSPRHLQHKHEVLSQHKPVI